MMAGRLVCPALRWRPETGFSHEAAAIDAALELGVAGFIIFGVGGARADEVATLTGQIRVRAGRPLLLAADMERGAGQQAKGLAAIPPPAALASLADDAVIAWAGATTARDALSVGLNAVFAPDADLDIEPANPIVQTRSFGAEPAAVGHAVATWIAACQAEGVLASAKHYPGHGRTAQDSHNVLPAVSLSLGELEATDLRPFAAAVQAGVAMIMTAHVGFPSWDPTGAPATLSPVILGHLRQALGFDGLVVTDALIMEGARGGRTPGAAAVAALAAGCDLLLYPGDLVEVVRAITHATDAGVFSGAGLERSIDRMERLLAAVESPGVPRFAPRTEATARDAADQIADRLLERGLVRGIAPALDGIDLVIIDDDTGGWYAPGPSDVVRRSLASHKMFERAGGSRVVLVFAEPRAAKGRAGLGPESLARLAALAPDTALVVVFGHPRLVEQIPAGPPVLLAWHRQPLMQQAVTRWLLRMVRVP